tara:strand:+ start:3268 stop:3438 length:171 start_codon:yes stop_codon:yes gene_type:complete
MTPERKLEIKHKLEAADIDWDKSKRKFRAMLGETMNYISFLEAKLEAQQKSLNAPR